MKTSPAGIDLIKTFEGFSANAYADVAGVWTIGYGFTRGVQRGDTITRAQADTRLRGELMACEQAVDAATHGAARQHQFDALVSFAYNVGAANMARSSVIRAFNAGDMQAAARAFALWNKAGGQTWPGLTRRRAAESALFLTPDADDDEHDMPREVEPERAMTASPINRAAALGGGTATLAAVAEGLQQLAGIKASVSAMGVWLLPVLLTGIAGLCGYIVWQRLKQRREGWA